MERSNTINILEKEILMKEKNREKREPRVYTMHKNELKGLACLSSKQYNSWE